MTTDITLQRFLTAMDGEWLVDGYDICEDGRVQVNYRSRIDTNLTWSHRPFTISGILPIGTVIRIGAIKMADAE